MIDTSFTLVEKRKDTSIWLVFLCIRYGEYGLGCRPVSSRLIAARLRASFNIITVNPLHNDIPYNSKIRYNVKLVCKKNQRIVYFFIDIPILFLRKVLCIC